MTVDLVLPAMGFLHVPHTGLVSQFGLELDDRGNVVVRDHHSSEDGVFAAGDTAEGASPVVRAIASGRNAARHRRLARRQRPVAPTLPQSCCHGHACIAMLVTRVSFPHLPKHAHASLSACLPVGRWHPVGAKAVDTYGGVG